jgi:hypothetical protein
MMLVSEKCISSFVAVRNSINVSHSHLARERAKERESNALEILREYEKIEFLSSHAEVRGDGS